MATSTSDLGVFQEALADAITATTQETMAPLGLIHRVWTIGPENDDIKIPAASGVSAVAATQGAVTLTATEQHEAPATVVTPIPYRVTIGVPLMDISNEMWFDDTVEKFTEAFHKQIMALLVQEYDDLTVAATGAAGTATAAVVAATAGAIGGNGGGSGPYGLVVNPITFSNIISDLGSNYTAATVGSDVLSSYTQIAPVYGNLMYADSGVDQSGSVYRGFMGRRGCIHIVYRGDQMNVTVTDVGDGVNVAFSAALWVAVDTIAANQGRYFSTLN